MKTAESPTIMAVDDADAAYFGNAKLYSGDRASLVAHLSKNLPPTTPRFVFTLNVDQCLEVIDNPPLALAYDRASLVLVDGAPVLWLARLLGSQSTERITGAELLPLLARFGARAGWKLAIVGGADGVAESAARRLNERYSADVVAVDFPTIADVTDDACQSVVDELAMVHADIVFVCLGCPKQEMWMTTWSSSLPPAFYIGAGAAVDFAAGTARRAPMAMQRAGMEWVWRLVFQPGRLWRRYLVRGPRFLAVAARSLRTRRRIQR